MLLHRHRHIQTKPMPWRWLMFIWWQITVIVHRSLEFAEAVKQILDLPTRDLKHACRRSGSHSESHQLPFHSAGVGPGAASGNLEQASHLRDIFKYPSQRQ